MVRILIIILAILGALFLVGGGYFLGLQSGQSSSKNSEISKTTNTPTVTPTKEIAPTATPIPKDTKTILKEAFENKNFDSLKPRLAASVDLLLFATSCCGAKTDQTEIIQFISGSFDKGGSSWDFDVKDSKYASIVASLKSGEFLVVSSTGPAIIFTLDSENKIKKVFFYTDYRLIGS